MFGKLFGKKDNNSRKEEKTVTLNKGDVFVSLGDDLNFKITRQLSPELKEQIERSTLGLMNSQLFMHYWDSQMTDENRDDPAWQNQALFFWRAEEEFPKKSLPPAFESYEKKYFVIINIPADISFESGQVMPWFGMPGLGQKFSCKRGDIKLSLPELAQMKVIEYLDFCELTEKNTEILHNREQFYFLIDERIVQFRNNGLYVHDKLITLELAYSIGGVHIVKRV